MLRLIFLTLLLALMSLGAAWLSAHPGEVNLTWLGWRVETSASVLLFAITALALAGAAVIAAVNFVLHMPARLRRRNVELHYVRGLRALTQSLVQLADGNMEKSRAALKHAQKFLGPTPITLLLEAQMERLQGNQGKTRALLETMLSHSETRRIAAKGLSEFHVRQGAPAQAIPLAQAAAKLAPGDRKALATLVAAHTRLGQWQEAEAAVRHRAWFIPRAERNRLRGLIFASRALQLQQENDGVAARSFALRAMKFLPDFAPLPALAARLMPEPQAVRLLRRAWKRAPHPALADALLAILPPEEAWKTARLMARTQPDSEDSHLLLARAAMAAQHWDEARRALKTALALRESATACRMVAQLEDVQYHDADAAARWRLRADAAAPDAEWTCASCAQVNPIWSPDCPRCHAFDSMEWKRRSVRYSEA